MSVSIETKLKIMKALSFCFKITQNNRIHTNIAVEGFASQWSFADWTLIKVKQVLLDAGPTEDMSTLSLRGKAEIILASLAKKIDII